MGAGITIRGWRENGPRRRHPRAGGDPANRKCRQWQRPRASLKPSTRHGHRVTLTAAPSLRSIEKSHAALASRFGDWPPGHDRQCSALSARWGTRSANPSPDGGALRRVCRMGQGWANGAAPHQAGRSWQRVIPARADIKATIPACPGSHPRAVPACPRPHRPAGYWAACPGTSRRASGFAGADICALSWGFSHSPTAAASRSIARVGSCAVMSTPKGARSRSITWAKRPISLTPVAPPFTSTIARSVFLPSGLK